MKQLTRKASLFVTLLLSVIALNGCSTVSPYRSYNLSEDCNYYYVDMYGNKIYGGKYNDAAFTGLTMRQDASGRWYYQDSFGNRMYKSSRCGECHKSKNMYK